jgi:acyl-CoA thioesterase
MGAVNNGIDKGLFNQLVKINSETDYHKLIGMDIVELGQGYAIMEVEIKNKHLNILGIAHGGVLFSIMDTTMAMAAKTIGKDIISLEMNINFISPGKLNDKIRVVGKVIHPGKKTTITICDAYNQQNVLVASARQTFYNMN